MTWAPWMLIGLPTSTSPMAIRPLDLYDEEWPIWTNAEITPPAKVIHNGQRAEMSDSPCPVGASLREPQSNGPCSSPARGHPGANLEEAVVLPNVEIGRRARLKKVIIDRGVRISARLAVGEDPDLDAQRFRCTAAGVCLVTQQMSDWMETQLDLAAGFCTLA